MPLAIAGSVDEEHGLAADAPLQKGVERSGRLAPRAFELDLAVQPPLSHQRAEASEISSSAAVETQVLEQVQRVDHRALRAVEARRVEGDGFVVALGRDVDDAATRGDVLDGKAERRASDSVEDQVEVAADGLDDLGRAETAKEFFAIPRRRGPAR